MFVRPFARSFLGLVCLALLAWMTSPLRAQAPQPRIGYIYPAGGRAGSSFSVRIGGQNLEGVTNAFVSAAGIQAKVTGFTRPMTPNEFNMLKEKAQALREKRRAHLEDKRLNRVLSASTLSTNTWTAADDKLAEEYRKKLASFVRRPPNPAIAENVSVNLALATNLPPGDYELRLSTPNGLSNPLLFCVGQLPEVVRKPPVSTNEITPNLDVKLRNETERAIVTPEIRVALPAVINGQILPGAIDRYRFTARAGQHLVAAVRARTLIPYLPDAVPGWIQPTLTLLDAKRRELAYADDFRFSPDPVLHYAVTNDGEYLLEIKDAIYRGREDFVYRITAGELPYLTGVFPLGGSAGSETVATLSGWNLPQTNRALLFEEPGLHRITVEKDGWVSNPLPFAVDNLPETTDDNPDTTAPQLVTPPVVINGRLDTPGDSDSFRFRGQAGDPFVAEVMARRLGSPLDSLLKLFDSEGRLVASNDDHEDRGSGLDTHHADSYLSCTLPEKGMYTLRLGDTQQKSGPEYTYRLRLGPPPAGLRPAAGPLEPHRPRRRQHPHHPLRPPQGRLQQ